MHRKAAAHAAGSREVTCAVLTVSDTRTLATDKGGDTVVHFLEEAGHKVVTRDLVKDEGSEIRGQLQRFIADEGVHAVITTGGTGIANRDTTIDVVREMLTIELEGFGELFRYLSYKEVGPAAMLSRAVAGLVCPEGAPERETIIFSIPGSVNAVETAMRNLIAPELSHLVWERKR
ncbi:MAG TPA: MogA/MoaB family molybdenum cofactor biosynthesis protein [Phycisphaeraceae bacterium]|nr:MogA/MoaB family molybdenum cofactor biosynthesis protein [Phycisphaeraceae bacterium]